MTVLTQAQIKSAIASSFRFAFPRICTGIILVFATIAAIVILIVESANPQEFPIETTATPPEQVSFFPNACLPKFEFGGVTGDSEVVLDGAYCHLGDWVPLTKKGLPTRSKPALVKAYRLAIKNPTLVTPSAKPEFW